MSEQNKSVATWYKAQGSNITATGQITTKHSVLHAILVNSHTTGSFRIANGTATAFTAAGGTYTPAAGSSVIEYKELEFASGMYIQTAGTLNLTAVFNDLV